MRYGSSGVSWPRIRSQLTLAHDALVRLIDALYLIFKFAAALRQSFDYDIRSVRGVQANRARRKQPLADLEFVLGHDAYTTLGGNQGTQIVSRLASVCKYKRARQNEYRRWAQGVKRTVTEELLSVGV
jgi:hypothetical protein